MGTSLNALPERATFICLEVQQQFRCFAVLCGQSSMASTDSSSSSELKLSSWCCTVFQVLGTLFIYVLFMVEEFRKEPVENMDDVIYYVNGTYRLLEFLVALCVVAYGVSETIFGEWTVMGSVIIFIHSYYNVWLRAQLGWKSFLLRRDAVNKIKSLPVATKEQLEQHNDICAICYQVGMEVLKGLA